MWGSEDTLISRRADSECDGAYLNKGKSRKTRGKDGVGCLRDTGKNFSRGVT